MIRLIFDKLFIILSILISGLLGVTSMAPKAIAHILFSFLLTTKEAFQIDNTISCFPSFSVLFPIWGSRLIIRHLKMKVYDLGNLLKDCLKILFFMIWSFFLVMFYLTLIVMISVFKLGQKYVTIWTYRVNFSLVPIAGCDLCLT